MVAIYIVVRDLIRDYWTTRGAKARSQRAAPSSTLSQPFFGVATQLQVWPGGHDNTYRHAHLRQYLAFYARDCA